MVYVHGISRHGTGYSNGWWASLEPHLQGFYGDGALGQGRREVLWSRIVNPDRAAAHDVLSADDEAVRQMIQETIEDRALRELPEQRSVTSRAVVQPPEVDADIDRAAVASGDGRVVADRLVATRGGGWSLDDFMLYMTQRNIRRAILDIFHGVMQTLANQERTEIDIICHSWGTVVTFEALHETDRLPAGLNVANLFTVGAALSLAPVRWKLGLTRNPPPSVRRWYNLDAKGDPVGGGLKGAFNGVTEDYLSLTPVGCTAFLGFYGVGCAHSSYFKPDNLLVNRDIFARHILE
ncbi:MAG: hypothetical protein QM770_21830 [Tepidisphaeraceae bacterium]